MIPGYAGVAPLSVLALLVAMGTVSPRARAEQTGESPRVVRIPRSNPPTRHGFDVDAMAGLMAIPTPVDPRVATVDRYLGLRAGYRLGLGPLRLGLEGAWRSTLASTLGARPLTPVLAFPLLRLSKGPHQTLRQFNQVALGATAGFRVQKTAWFVEPQALAGFSASWRVLLVGLDRPIPYNRSYPTAGGYLGLGLMTGLLPLTFRMDCLLMQEFGPPPFTTSVTQLQYNVSTGIRF